jgi:phosphohistidine phosphatase
MSTLYIVRHAYAGQHGDPRYPDDSLRPLTKRGVKQFRKVVKKLHRIGFAPEVLATSPLIRCKQTADVICERVFPPPEFVELDALQPGSELDTLIAWTNARGAESTAWVGHAPDVDHLAAALLGMDGRAISFSKGAVAAIRFDEHVALGEGGIRWFAGPKLLGC